MWGGDLFEPFKYALPYFRVKPGKVVIRNWIYSLSSKWSQMVFFYTQMFLSCRFTLLLLDKYPMHCFVNVCEKCSGVAFEFTTDYCWVHGTYVVEEYMTGRIGKNVVYPGVGPEQDLKDSTATFTRIYNRQYMLYPFILLIQYALFRFSRHFWNHLEGGRLSNLISELNTAIPNQEIMKERLSAVAVYMTSHRYLHNYYAYKYILMEVYNGLNIVFQFYLVNYFLQGKFMNYGVEGVKYIRAVADGQRGLVNPFWMAFPKVAKCEMEIVGPSGNMQPLEALCILPINNIAEKIFFVMWFWLIIVGSLNVIGLMYRCLVVSSRSFRFAVVRIKANKASVNVNTLKVVTDKLSYGDWFMLSLMQKNMYGWVFTQLVEELQEKIRDSERKEL